MQHDLTARLNQLQLFLHKQMRSPFNWSTVLFVTLGLSVVCGGGFRPNRAAANPPESAPAPLKSTLSQIDAAANSHNVQAVMQFYGAGFSTSDGLTRSEFEKTLQELWQRYAQVTYRTELKSWQPAGNGFVVETITMITGKGQFAGKESTLKATVASRQRIEDQKIVQQEILAEQSFISSGSNPPKVDVNLPDQVTVNQEFNFDAIVKEPLGDSVLLGAAMEETVKPGKYLGQVPAELELLSAGGIFKVGRAPSNPENRWISAVLLREDGMTLVTQRIKVVTQGREANSTR